jgi:long-chain acyl-CoA synthetase
MTFSMYALDLDFVGDVTGDRHRGTAVAFDARNAGVGGFGAYVVAGDAGAVPGKHQGEAAADVRAGARDQRNLAIERDVHASVLLLVEENFGLASVSQPLTCRKSLAEAARRFGGSLAYAEGSQRPTWSEIAATVDSAAAGLADLGLQKGDRVAICAENSIEWIVAYHAIARAGGIAVLVYHDLEAPEIERQVRRPECRFLIASGDVVAKVQGGATGVEHVLAIGERGTAGETQHFADVRSSPDGRTSAELDSRAPVPDDTAVITYTSGTTGGAKGVMLSHRNLLSNAMASIDALELTDKDSSLLVLPMHHAMPFIAAVLLPPLLGAHFFIENDLRRIRDRLQEHRPTVFFGVPALYELMHRNVLARAEAEGRLETLKRVQRWLGRIKRLTGVNLAPLAFRPVHKALGGRLRFLISGGAALNTRTYFDFAALGLPLLQGWGMAEAAPVIAVQRWSRRRFRYTNHYEKHAGSVGQALPDVEVRLIDVPEKGISVADSGEGEVLVRGPNVFQGYWQAEDTTAEALRDGWLHTGDLGRIDAQGNIYLTGRSKYVIVLDSGEKVHPDELEETLAQDELLADCCVLGRASAERQGRTQVTAVIYPDVEVLERRAGETGGVPDEAGVRSIVEQGVEAANRRLAGYKRIVRVELSHAPLPKTALRKVARGHIAASHEFDYGVWLKSRPE